MTLPEAPAWLLTLEQSALGQLMRESLWLYPAVETAHIAGFAGVVGGIAVWDLRLMGVARSIPLRTLLRVTIPLALAAFAVAMPTGALLFLTEATAYAANPVFPIKLGLIGAAGINALLFHVVTAPRIAAWSAPGPLSWPARAHGAASLLCWVGALVCGRLIAYL